jgi:hypothetical protein
MAYATVFESQDMLSLHTTCVVRKVREPSIGDYLRIISGRRSEDARVADGRRESQNASKKIPPLCPELVQQWRDYSGALLRTMTSLGDITRHAATN